MRAEDAFANGPIYYQDGAVQMRLALLEPNIGICLEWLCNGEWHEVSSMRPAAFNAFLNALEAQK